MKIGLYRGEVKGYREREYKKNLPKEIIQDFGLIEESDNKDEFLAAEGI